MIASVNNQGKAHWMMVDKAFDAAMFMEFLEGLIKDGGNPEEHLHADLKHRLRSKVQVRPKEKLRAATQAHMQEIKAQPECVVAYFRDPHVQYASGFNG